MVPKKPPIPTPREVAQSKARGRKQFETVDLIPNASWCVCVCLFACLHALIVCLLVYLFVCFFVSVFVCLLSCWLACMHACLLGCLFVYVDLFRCVCFICLLACWLAGWLACLLACVLANFAVPIILAIAHSVDTLFCSLSCWIRRCIALLHARRCVPHSSFCSTLIVLLRTHRSVP